MPRLFMDIETSSNPDTLPFMPEPEAPGNLKDPEKIKAAVAEKKQEQIDRAPLDPDYGRILSLGYTTEPDGDIDFLTTFVTPEKDILLTFWEVLKYCRGNCVGYNILGFDIPYLLRRSLALGIPVPYPPNLAKFRTEPITDLMGILYNWGPAKSLKQVAKLYSLPVLAEGVDGSQVKNLSKEELIKYQISDVRLVVDLWKRMNNVYFKHPYTPKPAPEPVLEEPVAGGSIHPFISDEIPPLDDEPF